MQSIDTTIISKFICPACDFLSKKTLLDFNTVFKCFECESSAASAPPTKQKLFCTFKVHSKNGYKCNDCKRFIPHPLDNSSDVECPYYDCLFVGKIHSLKKMRHPTTKTSANVFSTSKTLRSESEEKSNVSILKDIITSQVNTLYYSGFQSTLTQKLCMYQAFLNMIDKFPNEMIAYLVLLSRKENIQHKIFQEYVSLIESKIPFSFLKNGEYRKINSILDEELSLFDGISIFEADVSSKREVKNLTKEFYVGGRNGFYSKPFYIGKLLDIINLDNKKSILSNVVEYSFSKIILKDIVPGTKVQVTHLRIPPHYQMGGMVHLNRIRKKIVDKVQSQGSL